MDHVFEGGIPATRKDDHSRTEKRSNASHGAIRFDVPKPAARKSDYWCARTRENKKGDGVKMEDERG